MNEASKPASLAEELAAREAQDKAAIKGYRKAIAEDVKDELVNFGNELLQSAKAEQQRRANAMRADLARVQWLSVSTWAKPFLTAAAVVLGLWFATETLIGVLSWDLQRLYENREQLKAEIEQQQKTVERLGETTWGVWLHKTDGGRRFVVLPEGTFLNDRAWRVDGKRWVELLSE